MRPLRIPRLPNPRRPNPRRPGPLGPDLFSSEPLDPEPRRPGPLGPDPLGPGLLGPEPLGKRRLSIAGCAAVAVLLVLAGCGSSSASWRGPGGAAPSGGGKSQVTITAPTDGATNVPASAEIQYTVAGSSPGSGSGQATVRLVDDANGSTVDGAWRSDGSSWVPQQALKYATKFTVTVTVPGAGGPGTVTTAHFTTMPKPASTSHLNSQMGDNLAYGVGAPIVLNFSAPIPEDKRADVQRRLFVHSTPEQEGSWNWFSATEVHFRPKEYWQPGTKISMRALFGGVPLGNGRYGDNDLTVDASIVDHALSIVIDDSTKHLTVTRDGQVLRTIPASLGKSSTPSSSGNMVIMTRATQEIFDSSTNGVPVNSPGGYRETVYYPLRLTWDGQYIHAAPWSQDQQGRYDVSHGCTNISMDNAKWLYEVVHIGDPVVVRNTGSRVPWGDGWTDWDRSWDEYVQGSAIPYHSTSSSAPSSSPVPSSTHS